MNITFGPHHFLTYRLGAPYAIALQQAGHHIVNDHGEVGLFDCDAPADPWLQALDRHHQVVLYPHGAGAQVGGLGQHERHRNVIGQFVVGDGEVAMAKIAGDTPTVACGWPWTPLQDFEPAQQVERLFFAPPHSYHGTWSEQELAEWAQVERVLLERFPAESGVKWFVSNAVRSLDETAGLVQSADLVVTASASVLRLAVALGRPAVLWGDADYHFHWLDADGVGHLPPPAVFDRLAGMYRYPYGINDLSKALAVEASDWREQFVGTSFDPHLATQAFDGFVGR